MTSQIRHFQLVYYTGASNCFQNWGCRWSWFENWKCRCPTNSRYGCVQNSIEVIILGSFI